MSQQTNGQIGKANEWKAKATAIVTCPSGTTVKVRRVSRGALLSSGRLPQPLVKKVLDAFDEVKDLDPKAQMSDSFMQKLPELTDAMILELVVEPKVVLGEAGDSEINVREIPDADRDFLYQYAMNGSPHVPVQTEGGEVSLEQVESFRSEPGVSGVGDDGQDVSETAVATTGSAG